MDRWRLGDTRTTRALRRLPWRHGLAAGAYALGYAALREVSWSHWVLFAGYRLCALLFVPGRYWPALLVGEEVPLAARAASYAGEFGLAWALLMAVPPIGLAMPIVWKYRRRPRRGGRIPPDGRMARLLTVALAVSAVWTLANAAVLLVAHLPPGYPAIRYVAQIARWFVGNYLGCLTLAPVAMFAYGHLRGGHLGWRRPALWHRPFVRAALLALAAVAALTALAVWVREDALGQAAQLSIWVPVVWLALRYGAPGAAIGGLVASVGVALTMPALNDPATLRAEILLAFVISTVLLFGDRIAMLASLGHQARRDASRLRGLARNAVALGEAQMRLASEAVDLVRETVRESEERVMDRFHAMWPDADGREFKRRNLMTLKHLYEVSDGLHSVTLRECGLVMALDIGSIWDTLHAAGVAYACDTERLDVASLDDELQAMVYRLACEVASYLCASHGICGLELILRSGAYGGRRWVLLQARASLVPGISPRLHAALPHRLGGHGMGLRAIRDKAEIYEGAVRVRQSEERVRLSVLLHPPEEGKAAPSPGRRSRPASPFN